MKINIKSYILRMQQLPEVFFVTLLVVTCLFLFGASFPQSFSECTNCLNKFIFNYFGNFYLWFAIGCVLCLLLIAISPLGNIRVGGRSSVPKHSYFSWMSMLFCAGMGVGLLYWGSAEPLYHYLHPPIISSGVEFIDQINAFKVSFFHWGITPWGIYGLTTIAVAFFLFNKKRKLSFSSFLYSKKDDNDSFKGVFSRVVDVFTISAIFFGIVSTFGMGVIQVEGGLNFLTGIKSSMQLHITIILAVTICYIFSTFKGLNKGIKILSNVSIIFSFFLFAAVFFFVPKEQFIIPLFKALPEYLKSIFALSIGEGNYASNDFVREWTVKYWSWWIAWAPFVGLFVALISYGRTIREIALSMLVVPTIYSLIWISVFGAASIYTNNNLNLALNLSNLENTNLIMFKTVYLVTHSKFFVWFGMMLVMLFFINSADSATYTLAAMSSEANEQKQEPSKFLQFAWGCLFSIMTIIFLFSGGIYILQEITLITVLPFTLILILVFLNLIKLLTQEHFLKVK